MRHLRKFIKFESMLQKNNPKDVKEAFAPYINKGVINLIEAAFLDYEDEYWKCQLWVKAPWRSDSFDVIYTNLDGWSNEMIFKTDDILKKFKQFYKRNKRKNAIRYYIVITKENEENLSSNETVMLNIEKIRIIRNILHRVDAIYEIYDIEYGKFYVDFKIGDKKPT